MKKPIFQYYQFVKFIWILLLIAGFSSATFGATFVVANTNDNGVGSLRQTIANAESTTGDDIIEFDQSVFNVPRIITLTGGVIRILNGGGLVINGTGADLVFVSGNNQSGIFYVSDPVNLTINRMTLFNAVTGSDGGAVVNFGTLTINDSIIKNNIAEFDGGGIKNFRNFTLNRSSVTGNSPAGISNENFSATINNSSIKDNFGVGISTNWTLNVNNSTISGNNNGGLYSGSNGGTPVVTNVINSTISGNFRGSGITLDNITGTLNLINATVAFNSAMSGGGVTRVSGTINARNSIIARNTGGLFASDFSGTLNSQGYNIIGTTAFMTITGNTTGNQLNVDPLLLPLGDYGGLTQTHALQANSPAIDAGDEANVLAADQRGVSRPFDGDGNGAAYVDIGAVEAGILVTNTNDSGTGSLRQALAVSNAAATVDEIRFSTLFDVPQTITLTSGELNIASDRKVFINGSGADKLIISGNNQSRVFSISSGANATLNNLSLANGSAAFDGGSILNNGELTIEKAIVRDNRAGQTSTGGGIYNASGGILIVSNSTIRNNTARTGGGIGNASDGQLTVRNSTIRQNAALTEDGGGIINFGGKASISNTTISNNTAYNAGGGIANEGNTDILTLTNSVINGNTATGNGGGLYNSGLLNVNNTTVSGNSATLDGGGLYNSNAANLMSATIGGNSSRGGGGVFNFSGELIVRNTIVAKNMVTGSSPDFLGTITSQGYNLIGNTSGTIVTGNSNGNLLNVDPLFLPLADNGGATFTHALQTNSPAVDAGDSANVSATDQRGFNRIADGDGDGTPRTDIGAYESGMLVSNVNNSGAGSLRQAILDARDGTGDDEIRFSTLFNMPQTIVLTGGQLFVGGNGRLVINGAGASLTTISGNNQSRVFNVSVLADLTLNGVTVTGGRILFDGGGIINNGTLRINNSSVSGNTGSSGGGTPNGGGGIFNNLGRLTVTNSSVNNNTLINGSGGGILNNNGVVNITNSSISNNTAGSEGGGLSIFGGTVTITDSAINSNTANRSGGIQNGGTLTMTNASVSGNTSQQLYGGIYNSGRLTLNGSTVSNNRIINTNQSSNDGGGIFNLGTTMMVSSTISGNTASFGSGINNNGGINNDRGRLTVINSTISSNRATIQGGGIYTIGGVVSLINTTVAFNSANSGGGVLHVGDANGIFNARNTLIANNTTGSSTTPSDFKGILSSQGYNLIGNTNDIVITGITTSNLLNINPRLDPVLRDNGGVTRTHALRIDSPAIDKGSSVAGVTTDQRGVPRPFDFPSVPNAGGGNGSDIGALERQLTDVDRLTLFDFDGDGKSDISVFRPENGSWYLQQSMNGFIGIAFGQAGDKIVPADYDGDGKTDVAVYRGGTWYLNRSQLGFTGVNFGTADDIPQPADFDGDGKAELAVFRPSNGTWYVLNLATNQFSFEQFGQTGDKPVAADYDGDGKADYAVYRDGGWYILRSSQGFIGIQFGEVADRPVPADYDGDGKADVAVFRPSNGTWYLNRSTAGFVGIQFGISTDVPAPADYDGDGRADIAVFRDGNWYLNRSTAGFTGVAFGSVNDKPVPNAFIP